MTTSSCSATFRGVPSESGSWRYSQPVFFFIFFFSFLFPRVFFFARSQQVLLLLLLF